MKELRYRGQPYSQSHQQISTIASGYTACYRGQSYNTRLQVACQSRSLEASNSAVFLTYRGVSFFKQL